MDSKEELKQVLKYLKISEWQFDQVCEVAYKKVIKKRTEADKKMTTL
tara:strand:+ start:825 stop:965 length:141 start_codon:yes stop_codon:yes gene_type:complete